MSTEEKALIKGKRLECCIGFFFLIPPIVGVIAFVLCMYDSGIYGFARLANLFSHEVSNEVGYYSYNVGWDKISVTVYLTLMAFVGAYLIKDSLKYLFMTTKEKKEATQETPKPKE